MRKSRINSQTVIGILKFLFSLFFIISIEATVWISQVEQLLLLSRVSLQIKQNIHQKQRNVLLKYQHLVKILMLNLVLN
ncbi:unnamed protein product [Acanthoscelides obtectus]|uniref:Uncharacterized protein n=1 Tax=Acanthoscelides obtectus TaxID=200917 RepID=A0A9P0JQG0_ACAOB|nr:unnamed protein product [Acanthoscelides obtectus]CAK1673839.1 hypothetical protein AOBTE_LOCUS29455 [Acanthoscelides obtectus]